MDSRSLAQPDAWTIRQQQTTTVQIKGDDERTLLTIHRDGTVEVGSLDDATEAAQVFVREVGKTAGWVPAEQLDDAKRDIDRMTAALNQVTEISQQQLAAIGDVRSVCRKHADLPARIEVDGFVPISEVLDALDGGGDRG